MFETPFEWTTATSVPLLAITTGPLLTFQPSAQLSLASNSLTYFFAKLSQVILDTVLEVYIMQLQYDY